MKAEERHELRENDLANWLQYGLWAFLKQNGSYLLLIAALGFLGYRLWALYESRQEQARQAAFAILLQDENSANTVTTPDEWLKSAKSLDDLIATTDIKIVKARACLALGRLYNFWAAFPEMQSYAKRSRAECLSKSYECYSQALAIQGKDSLIAAKAHLGIAAVYEDQEEWAKAKAEYQLMMDDKLFAGDLANLAKARLDSLDSRRNAPRLADMIPLPPAPKPEATPGLPGFSLPGGGLGAGLGGSILGPGSSSAFPGLVSPGGVGTSSGGATSAPAPSLPFGPMPQGPAPSPTTEPK